jgi:hypothetical protein
MRCTIRVDGGEGGGSRRFEIGRRRGRAILFCCCDEIFEEEREGRGDEGGSLSGGTGRGVRGEERVGEREKLGLDEEEVALRRGWQRGVSLVSTLYSRL